jgi:hypothetical protein
MQITKKRSFTVVNNIKKPIEFKFLNRLGGWDSIQFVKYKTSELKVSPTTFNTKYGTMVSYVTPTTTITYYSTLLTEAHFYWLIDLSLSTRIYVNNKLMNVIPGSFKFDTYTDTFYQLEINLTPVVDEKYIKM